MGIGTRIFLIDENDSLHRISTSLYNRLTNPDSDECFTQYAGKRVRCAMIFLMVKGRIPLSVVRTEYYYLTFDSEGQVIAQNRKDNKDSHQKLFHLFSKTKSQKGC